MKKGLSSLPETRLLEQRANRLSESPHESSRQLAERCIVRVDQVLSLNEAELVARNSA